MYFSWYSGSYCTDPSLEDATPEAKANPSMGSWGVNSDYLSAQRARLPWHHFRRLHLNEPGTPSGAFFSPDKVLDCIIPGRTGLPWVENTRYAAFVDMSGGSSDEAALAIAHWDETRKVAVLDLVATQAGRPPFNPRAAVRKFSAICKQYHISNVTGDKFAGDVFVHDFAEHGIGYQPSTLTKSQLYEALEPHINAREAELLDLPKLQEQLLGLVTRGVKIDHLPGEYDDIVNAAAGALHLVTARVEITPDLFEWGTPLTDHSLASLTGDDDWRTGILIQ